MQPSCITASFVMRKQHVRFRRIQSNSSTVEQGNHLASIKDCSWHYNYCNEPRWFPELRPPTATHAILHNCCHHDHSWYSRSEKQVLPNACTHNHKSASLTLSSCARTCAALRTYEEDRCCLDYNGNGSHRLHYPSSKRSRWLWHPSIQPTTLELGSASHFHDFLATRRPRLREEALNAHSLRCRLLTWRSHCKSVFLKLVPSSLGSKSTGSCA